MREGLYTPEEIAQFDNETLATAWDLCVNGRQYDGVEHDRQLIGSEMAERLTEDE